MGNSPGAFGKQARTVEADVDRYGWDVEPAYVDGLDVNRELVAEGFAYVYRKYSDDPKRSRLEVEAKEKGPGLSADPNPILPCEWRKGARTP